MSDIVQIQAVARVAEARVSYLPADPNYLNNRPLRAQYPIGQLGLSAVANIPRKGSGLLPISASVSSVPILNAVEFELDFNNDCATLAVR
jgi:hypothetical protein